MPIYYLTQTTFFWDKAHERLPIASQHISMPKFSSGRVGGQADPGPTNVIDNVLSEVEQ